MQLSNKVALPHALPRSCVAPHSDPSARGSGSERRSDSPVNQPSRAEVVDCRHDVKSSTPTQNKTKRPESPPMKVVYLAHSFSAVCNVNTAEYFVLAVPVSKCSAHVRDGSSKQNESLLFFFKQILCFAYLLNEFLFIDLKL